LPGPDAVLALVALTVAFAASTAVFNSTYKQQAEVDARLTNGADVTVTQSPGAATGPAAAILIRTVKQADLADFALLDGTMTLEQLRETGVPTEAVKRLRYGKDVVADLRGHTLADH